MTVFPPIADYGFLSDCEVSCLVAPGGSVEWLCLPRPDAPSRTLCKKLLSLAGPLQLYGEEIDASSGEHLGNFPQAFTHLALIDAMSRLIEIDLAELSS